MEIVDVDAYWESFDSQSLIVGTDPEFLAPSNERCDVDFASLIEHYEKPGITLPNLKDDDVLLDVDNIKLDFNNQIFNDWFDQKIDFHNLFDDNNAVSSPSIDVPVSLDTALEFELNKDKSVPSSPVEELVLSYPSSPEQSVPYSFNVSTPSSPSSNQSLQFGASDTDHLKSSSGCLETALSTQSSTNISIDVVVDDSIALQLQDNVQCNDIVALHDNVRRKPYTKNNGTKRLAKSKVKSVNDDHSSSGAEMSDVPKQGRFLEYSERRMRKKGQNRDAAIRYRQKKRGEFSSLQNEKDDLEDTNNILSDKVDKLSSEIQYLKGLLREAFKAKGLLHPAAVTSH